MRSVKRPQAGWIRSPARTRPSSAGSDRSISRATRETSPIRTMARRRLSSRSSRQRSNGPSKVQTSGAGSGAISRPGRARGSSGARPPLRRGSSRRLQPRQRDGRLGDGRSTRRDGVVERAGPAADDLQRDLGGGIRAVIAGAVDAAARAQPVALGEDGDRLRPRAGLRAVAAPGRRRTTCRGAASCTRRAWPRPTAARLRGRAGPARRATGRRSESSASRSCRRASRCRGSAWHRRPARTPCAPCRRGGCTRGRSG